MNMVLLNVVLRRPSEWTPLISTTKSTGRIYDKNVFWTLHASHLLILDINQRIETNSFLYFLH
jgi:hypothetical protein